MDKNVLWAFRGRREEKNFKKKFQRGEIHSWELARILVGGEQEGVPGRSGSMSDIWRWEVLHTLEKQGWRETD